MDIEDKRQLLNYLEGLMAEQDRAIAKGLGEYINKNWRRTTKWKIEWLKKSLKEVA